MTDSNCPHCCREREAAEQGQSVPVITPQRINPMDVETVPVDSEIL